MRDPSIEFGDSELVPRTPRTAELAIARSRRCQSCLLLAGKGRTRPSRSATPTTTRAMIEGDEGARAEPPMRTRRGGPSLAGRKRRCTVVKRAQVSGCVKSAHALSVVDGDEVFRRCWLIDVRKKEEEKRRKREKREGREKKKKKKKKKKRGS